MTIPSHAANLCSWYSVVKLPACELAALHLLGYWRMNVQGRCDRSARKLWWPVLHAEGCCCCCYLSVRTEANHEKSVTAFALRATLIHKYISGGCVHFLVMDLTIITGNQILFFSFCFSSSSLWCLNATVQSGSMPVFPYS